MGLLCNFVNVLFFPLGLASLILIIIIIISLALYSLIISIHVIALGKNCVCKTVL